MAKTLAPTDHDSLKPIVEAIIFASEEPLGPRALIRLLFEDEKKPARQSVTDEQPETLFDGSEESAEIATSSEAEVPSESGEAPQESGAVETSEEVTPAETESGDEATTDVEGDEESSEPDGVAGEAEVSSDAEGEADAAETDGDAEGGEEGEGENVAEAEGSEAVETETDNGPDGDEEVDNAAGEKSEERTIGQKELRLIIDELNEEYEETGRPFRIVEIAGGFQFATTREYGEFVGLLAKEKARRRLSPAALETLAIVAYRQPVTKPEVEAIRGVNCDQVLLSLLERNLLRISGRADSVGKPLLYGTTEEFLRAFGLNSLSDLPKLRELEELMEEEAHSATRTDAIPENVTEELLELAYEAREQMGNGAAVRVGVEPKSDAGSDTASSEVPEGAEAAAGEDQEQADAANAAGDADDEQSVGGSIELVGESEGGSEADGDGPEATEESADSLEESDEADEDEAGDSAENESEPETVTEAAADDVASSESEDAGTEGEAAEEAATESDEEAPGDQASADEDPEAETDESEETGQEETDGTVEALQEEERS